MERERFSCKMRVVRASRVRAAVMILYFNVMKGRVMPNCFMRFCRVKRAFCGISERVMVWRL